MQIKEFLQDLINKEYAFYIVRADDNADDIIWEGNNAYINVEDYDTVITPIVFDDIVKNDKTLYGLYSVDDSKDVKYLNYENRKLCVVEVDPMIAFDEKYAEYEDECNLDVLIKKYMIRKTNFYIKLNAESKNINGARYVCNFKPELIEEGE